MAKEKGKIEKIDHSKHRQRLKKRFHNEGLGNFQPHNVLELLLFFSVSRIDTNDIAHLLIDEFGSLSGVLDAPYESLLKVNGIGEHSATLIKLIPELCRYYLEDAAANMKIITSSEDAAEYLIPKFVGLKSEHFYLLCLDNRGTIRKCSLISVGGFTYADANMRKIMSEVINSNATSAILAHNHPHGVAVPSSADRETTFNISNLLSSIDVRLSDHIIVSGDDYFAMAKHRKYSAYFNQPPLKKKVSDIEENTYKYDSGPEEE